MGIRGSLETCVSESVKGQIHSIVPSVMNMGANAFCESIPPWWIRKILRKYHDDHGEFDYEECANEIKNKLIEMASKNLFGKTTTHENGGE